MRSKIALTVLDRTAKGCGIFLALLVLNGCSTPEQNLALGIAGATAAGAYSPARDIEQIYYLGVFDPEEQLPPTIYRVTFRGQASLLSRMKFASGWVPAGVIDSLNGRAGLDPNAADDAVNLASGDPEFQTKLDVGRRLVMFGPEGFREAPRGHRLVLMMGASPDEFFEQIDKALGTISAVQVQRENVKLENQIFRELLRVQQEQEAIADIRENAAREFSE